VLLRVKALVSAFHAVEDRVFIRVLQRFVQKAGIECLCDTFQIGCAYAFERFAWNEGGMKVAV
jgi:hypothetical protein